MHELSPEGVSRSVREYYLELNSHQPELQMRYEECDQHGHLSPNGDSCDYCFRHLEYRSPTVDEIHKERENLPDCLQPCDAPLLWDVMQSEIGHQKSLDHLKGLSRLMDLSKLSKLLNASA